MHVVKSYMQNRVLSAVRAALMMVKTTYARKYEANFYQKLDRPWIDDCFVVIIKENVL